MSSLTAGEKAHLESLLGLSSGYIIDNRFFSDPTFGALFNSHRIDIHSPKYQTYGSSKAKKLRSFWEQNSDQVVGAVLTDIIDTVEAKSGPIDVKLNDVSLAACKKAALRLQGRTEQQKTITANEFLKFDIEFSDFTKLPIQTELIPILEGRLNEASRALSAKAYLSVVFMAGSVLEGVLLGSALARPREFNQAPISPKDKAGNVKQFQEWSLNDLIDVASHLGILKPDIKKFSHGLRDFRNYIHPNMQLISGFAPDEHTAKLCLQVLKAALASVAGTRK